MTRSKRKAESDRRRNIRFKVIDRAFGVTKPRHETVCNIIDISTEGIALSYMAESNFPETLFNLDLFLRGNGYFTKAITCRTASEELEPLNHPFRFVPLVRVGAEFIDLTAPQITQIEQFIETCTVGKVGDRRTGIERRFLENRRIITPDDLPATSERRHHIRDRRQGVDRRACLQ